MGDRKPLSRGLRQVMAAVVILVLVSCAGNENHARPSAATTEPELPSQALLSSSMRQQPVPGWTVTVSELDLPPGTVVRPVANVGDRGIFLGITDEGWWLIGLDVTSGRRIFGPVQLGPKDDATDFNCYVNGPPNVLCIRQGPDQSVPSTAWIIDTNSGTKVFDGPSDLRLARVEGQPKVEQVGDHVIAGIDGKGVYGVGVRGDLTWFVPGNGMLTAQFTKSVRDVESSPLAVQGSGGAADVIFSVINGAVVKPAVPQDFQLGRAFVYPGGFAYQYTPTGDIFDDRVALFDDTGRRLDDQSLRGTLDGGSRDLPLLSARAGRTLLTIGGRHLLELPPSLPPVDARLIGSRYFIAADANHSQWQQFDLATRAAGKTCEGHSLGYDYIASDGDVAVATDDRLSAKGIDLATCDVLWSTPGPRPDEAIEVWKMNTTLIQRTNDRLFSLVAPE
jgi:hypothetical protein